MGIGHCTETHRKLIFLAYLSRWFASVQGEDRLNESRFGSPAHGPKALHVLLISTVLLTSAFFLCGSKDSSAANVMLISEDFERVWPDKYFDLDPTPGSWRLDDANLVGDVDYWGASSYRGLNGSMSAWCAQIGNNSVNGVENRLNHYYDQGMSSSMALYVGNLFGYQSVTLAFWFWAITGNTTLADSFEVRSYDGANWKVLWEQPSVNSDGWQQASVSVPTNSSWISFYFLSGGVLPGGPYEGVYIDEMILIGEDVDAPYSYLVDVPESSTSALVEFHCVASDELGSGVDYIELFYRKDASDNYSLYSAPGLPLGRWETTAMSLNTSYTGGDGVYDVYTVATDNVGNVEPVPAQPDATVSVDTTPPLTMLNISLEPRNGWYNDWVMVNIDAVDNTSGVVKTMFAADSDVWQTYSSAFMFMTDRIHTIKVFSTDVAGNREENKTYVVKVDTTNPELSNVAVRRITSHVNDSSAIVFWTITDDTSGVDYYEISLDDGADVRYDNMTTWISMDHLADGNHTLVVRAYDLAGNVLVTTFVFDVYGSDEGGGASLLAWEVALAVIVIAGAVFLLILRGRRRPEQV